MAALELELWNVFTYYTIHGKSGNPEQMLPLDLYRLCCDCQMCDPAMHQNPVTQQDIHIAVVAEVKRRRRETPHSPGTRAVNYAEFLKVLATIATQLYGDIEAAATATDHAQAAFQQLLMENILPLAHRRNPQPIQQQLQQEDMGSLASTFQSALHQIFAFYMGVAQAEEVKLRKPATRSLGAGLGEELEPQRRRQAWADRGGSRSAVSYGQWMRFCADFGISSSALLSQIEAGDIFFASVSLAGTPGGNMHRKMRFEQFWEAFVRVALTAYRGHTDATSAQKVQSLLVYIWKHLDEFISQKGMDASQTAVPVMAAHKQSLMKAAGKLLNKTIVMWQTDQYCDYLQATDPGHQPETQDAFAFLAGEEGGDDEEGFENKPVVEIIDDTNGDLGDSRIILSELRELLLRKPEMGQFLESAMMKAGIISSE